MLIFSFLLAAADLGQGAQTPDRSLASPVMRKARDPALAVAEEFCLARQQNSIQAYEFFISRHPSSPLAVQARSAIDALRKTTVSKE